MAGRMKEVVMMRPDGSHAIPIQVPDYSPNDADREWVKTQIGDAPAREIQPSSDYMDALKAGIEACESVAPYHPAQSCTVEQAAASVAASYAPDYFGETVPVESLGRDHE